MVSFLCIFGTESKLGVTTSICTPKQVKYCPCKVTPNQLYSFKVVVTLLPEYAYSKEKKPPRNVPLMETCPMEEQGSSGSPLCSMEGQVAGLHRHFQSEEHHILCGNHPDSENSMKHNRAPTKSAAVQRTCSRALMYALCIQQMSGDALFRLSTKIFSTRKATNQEQRGS